MTPDQIAHDVYERTQRVRSELEHDELAVCLSPDGSTWLLVRDYPCACEDALVASVPATSDCLADHEALLGQWRARWE